MAQIRHLQNAPIVEALIDIRVETPDEFKAEELTALVERLRPDFPESTDQRRFHAQWSLDDEQPSSEASNNLAGFILRSASGFEVAQFRDDGFTFSRLKPYADWNGLRGKAEELWQSYTGIVGRCSVARLATRYINQLDVGLPVIDFSDYLTAPPIVPDGLPQDLTTFATTVNLHLKEASADVILKQGLRPTRGTSKIGILIDVDVFTPTELNTDSSEVWARIGELRDAKNRVFFSSITEKAAELCE